MLGGGVDAATLVAALGAGPPPPECRWGRRRAVEPDSLISFCSALFSLCQMIHISPIIEPGTMNAARLSHLPFWGPSEFFFLIN